MFDIFFQKNMLRKTLSEFLLKKNNANMRAGFTLVELLASLSIMLILVLLAFSSFSNYSNRQSYKSVVADVRDNVGEARQRTLASYEDTVYGVYIGTSTIEFFPGTIVTVGSANNTIIQLSSLVTATSSFSNGNTSFTFERITGAPTATGTIRISEVGTNASTTLTIFGSGLVE